MCEFCDIITTFGRIPRFKTPQQITAELNELKRRRMNIVFLVDDNLVGNKIQIKTILRHIIAWQETNGHALIFAAEASLDLAEDAELMQLMLEANILSVFIGIESPNEIPCARQRNTRASGRTPSWNGSEGFRTRGSRYGAA